MQSDSINDDDVRRMSKEQLQQSVLRYRRDENDAREINKWWTNFEKYVRQGSFGMARKALKNQTFRNIIGRIGKEHLDNADMLYDQMYKKYVQRSQQKWKFWLLAAVLGIILAATIYFTGSGSKIIAFLRNNSYHILVRVTAFISSIVAYVASVCKVLAPMIYHGLNYLIL